MKASILHEDTRAAGQGRCTPRVFGSDGQDTKGFELSGEKHETGKCQLLREDLFPKSAAVREKLRSVNRYHGLTGGRSRTVLETSSTIEQAVQLGSTVHPSASAELMWLVREAVPTIIGRPYIYHLSINLSALGRQFEIGREGGDPFEHQPANPCKSFGLFANAFASSWATREFRRP
ncbi:unnamed protein product [Nesidiocoris tenuis]|uniref:Uncharacterized protein n=1 Tax=Nesidiocoris tenuis TaxID=355587 RepID=A0A6H5G5P6_9HEMI|nr:unnamed protein product [Nesidiocoris tenuis]